MVQQKRHIFWVLLLSFLLIFDANGQTPQTLKRYGEEALEAEQYWEAVDFFDRYQKLRPNDSDIYEELCIGYYHVNRLQDAVKILHKISEEKINVSDEFWFYRARLLHENNQWLDAISAYKTYLGYGKQSSPLFRKAIRYIEQCSYAQKNALNGQLGYIESLGNLINSRGDDYGAKMFPIDMGKIFFSSVRHGNEGGKRNNKGYVDETNGTYKSDIYVAQKERGLWSYAYPIKTLINTGKNEELQCVSTDGKILYFTRSVDRLIGHMFASATSPEDVPLQQESIQIPMNPEYGDQDLFFLNENVIIFSAIREEGYGGYDLYISYKVDETWQEVRNMGSNINSPFNERTPYASPDFKRLYYSSDRAESYGGYDIFLSNWSEKEQAFALPHNLGIGINSSGDDLYFSLFNDYSSGVFSSNRKDKSIGGYDLFRAYFKQPVASPLPSTSQHVAAVIKSTQPKENLKIVDTNEAETSSEKELIQLSLPPLYYEKDDVILTHTNKKILSNAIEMLHAHAHAKILIKVFDDYNGSKHLDLFFCLQRGLKVAEFLTSKGITDSRIQITAFGSSYPIAMSLSSKYPQQAVSYINKRIDLEIFQPEGEFTYTLQRPRVPQGYTDNSFKNLESKLNSVLYRIQIITSNQHLDSPLLEDYPHPLVDKTGREGPNKYTLGLFTTYEEAQQFRKRLIQAGVKGAFIVPYIHGIRMSNFQLQQLKHQYPDIKKYLDPQ